MHLGSLLAALASYIDARFNRGSWLLRIEDLDPPREQPGATTAILHTLRQHGLHWDEEPLWQSARAPHYDRALDQLRRDGLLFDCNCSRQQLASNGACKGDCRERTTNPPPTATRIAVAEETVIRFEDACQGPQCEPLGKTLPDFVLQRKDKLYAYQLAVVVDDAASDITHIVRGADLLDSSPRQVYLQQQLGLPTPQYFHLPLLLNERGQKLSKQSFAPALDDNRARDNLRTALTYLRQSPAPIGADCDSILVHAIAHWRPGDIPGVGALGIAATSQRD